MGTMPFFGTGPEGSYTQNEYGYGGGNQYFNDIPSAFPSGYPNTNTGSTDFPSLSVPVAAGAVPPQGNNQYQAYTPGNPGGLQTLAASKPIGGGYTTLNPIAPGETQDLFNYLNSQIGEGVTPFNLATPLPSGGSTAPGQVTAPENPLLAQFQQYFQTGTIPGGSLGTGLSELSNLAKTGGNITALPAWQAAVAAEQQNIQMGEANIQEQFAKQGALGSSEFGTALSQYQEQATLDENAQLTSAQLQALEQQTQNQFNASQFLTQAGEGVSNALQGLDQQAVQNLLQEFATSQPQYNPLLQLMYGAATTFPPALSQKYGLTGLSAALGGAASAASAIQTIGNSNPTATGQQNFGGDISGGTQ